VAQISIAQGSMVLGKPCLYLKFLCLIDVVDDGPPPLVDFEDMPDLVGKF
jgi:hypothetical protein